MKKNKTILIFLLIALLLRLFYALSNYQDNVMADFVDDKTYMSVAETILEHGPLALNVEYKSDINKIRPGLPWLMAIIMSLLGKNWLILFIVNVVINTFSIYIIYLLGRDLFNQKVGLIAAFIAIVYVQYIKYIPTAGKEPWLVILFTSFFYLFNKLTVRKYFLKTTILMSLVFGLLIHIDERYIAYIPVFFFLIILFDKQAKKIGLQKAFLFAGLILILMVPWTIRNYAVHDKIIIMSPKTERIADKILGYEPNQKVRKIQKVENTYRYLTNEQIDSVINGTKKHFKHGIEIPPEQILAMKDGILPHKFNKTEKALSTIEELWRPIDLKREYEADGFRYNGIWSLKHNLSVGLTYGVVLILSLLGIILLLRERNNWGLIFLIIILYHTFVIHVLFMGWAQARYRLPIDFMLIISASYFIYFLTKRYAPKILEKL
jgi:hypothetical protein